MNYSLELSPKLPDLTVLSTHSGEPKCHGLLSSDFAEPMAKIRVLLADDHEAILARVSRLLGEEFEIVSTVGNGRDAVIEANRLRPDILIMDISMPILNGLEAVSQLRSCNSATKIVILTVHVDPEFVTAAFNLGASGYVVKEQVATDLVPAIQVCLNGGQFLSRSTQR